MKKILLIILKLPIIIFELIRGYLMCLTGKHAVVIDRKIKISPIVGKYYWHCKRCKKKGITILDRFTMNKKLKENNLVKHKF